MPYKDPKKQAKWQLARKRRAVKFVQDLKNLPCVDCKNTFPPVCMHFDHLGNKFMDISSMVLYSKKRLLAEIAKCELVCANCHAIRTYKRYSGVE